MDYVLITPAHNEEAGIGRTLESVVSQTCPPLRWIIVDDGSTDRTAEIVAAYAAQHPWIELLRRPRRNERTFAQKVHAFNEGLKRVETLRFDVVGNIDADISFGPAFFASLITRLSEDPSLGVVGASYTQDGWDSMEDSFEGAESVHGACQLFRYACFRDVGGYIPHAAGGIDWIAVTTARMRGWRTQSFPEQRYHHHRILGTAQRSQVGAMFDYGKKDYYLGGSPVWEVARVMYRMTKKPVLFGGLALLCGYGAAALSRMERPVAPELMRFHRREQMAKLGLIVSSLIRLKRIDKFRLRPTDTKPRLPRAEP
jgi:glycosyltransferase involved in cell wall biosynthesis